MLRGREQGVIRNHLTQNRNISALFVSTESNGTEADKGKGGVKTG